MSFLSKKITLSVIGVLVLLFSIIVFSGDSSPEQGTPQVSKQDTDTIAVIPDTTSSASVAEAVSSQSVVEEVTTEAPVVELYPVVKVVDGDTLSIQIDGQAQTIRLIGLDTPETVHPSKPVECFGLEASNRAKEVLTGARVSIETDTTQGTYDKYDRLLAYVILEDGTNFNKLMIEEGYAYEYTYSLPYKYQSEFKLAEQQAKEDKLGLWADGACEEEVTTVPVEKPQSTPLSSESASNYICSYNAYNCSDFSTHDEAQSVYELCGGVANDIHRLDREKDGLACETLP